jgi:phage repressor protein C with HTH and peptisase S24 domain
MPVSHAKLGLTHQRIWATIDEIAKRTGYSASGLAIAAGLDATSFNLSKRIQATGERRWPSTRTICAVLQVTDMTLTQFAQLCEE